MIRRNRKCGRLTRLLSEFLCVLMLVSIFTGCRDNGPRSNDSGNQSNYPLEYDASPSNPGTNFGEIVNMDEITDIFNVVFLIDTSSSIHESDPYRLALNAPSIFLESMFAGSANKERVAGAIHTNLNIITYNDTVNVCFNQLLSLDDWGTVSVLQNTLRKTKIPSSGAGDTALGIALEAAVDMFPEKIVDRPGSVPVIEGREKNLIILFTDGYSSNDIKPENPDPHSDMPYFGGNMQAPLERSLTVAKNCQCEIIVLGMNSGGYLDGYWDEFKKIANYTQLDNIYPMGLSEDSSYSMPYGELSDLPPIHSTRVGSGMFIAIDADIRYGRYVNYFRFSTAIYAQRVCIQIASLLLQGTGVDTPTTTLGETYNTYYCDVRNYGISAVVFYVLSGDNDGVYLDDLRRPSGDSLQTTLNDTKNGRTETGTFWDKDQRIRMSWYEGCAMVTVLDPEPGIWTLNAHTVSRDSSLLSVYVMQIDDINLELSFKQNSRYADEGTVFVRAKSHGVYMAEDFYKDTVGIVEIFPSRTPSTHLYSEDVDLWVDPSRATTATGNPLKEGSLVYDADRDSLAYIYRASFPGTHTVDAVLRVDDVEYTASGRIFFEARPSEDLYLKAGGRPITVVPILTDDWKDSIALEIESWSWSPRGLISVERDRRSNGALTVTGLEKGTGTLDVVAIATPDNLPFQRRITISYPVTVGR